MPSILALALAVAASARGDEKEKLEIPAPRDVSLETKDGVDLRCTYYPGGFAATEGDKVKKLDGKQVVPIIMVHGWEGQRGDYDELAKGLQRLGHASIVPDLRGHGASTQQKLPGRDPRTLDLNRMNKNDLANMVNFDLETVKSFLLKENNEGRVNIELLCVIGSQSGAILAMNWAAKDWSWPQLPTLKQGQDVKALVLLSPERQFKGLTGDLALRHPALRSQISMMIVAGRDSKEYADSRRLHASLERYRDDLPSDRQERLAKQDLFFVQPDTTLSGTKLLTGRGLPIAQNIAVFIDLRLVRKQDQFKWQDRSRRLAGG